MTLDKASEVASYNMMMTFLMDVMERASLKFTIAKFFFTGPFGIFFTFGLTYLVRFLSIQGINLAQNLLYEWHKENHRVAYEANMMIYHKQIDVKEVLSAKDISAYKSGIKAELKNFFNLSKYFKSK